MDLKTLQKRISFFSYRVSFVLRDKQKIRAWLQRCARNEGLAIRELNYIFCSDRHLLGLNKKFLGHQSLTDILTFDHRIEPRKKVALEADVFISIHRIRENAAAYNVLVRDELHRVMVHGLLHLAGYRDKTTAQARRMRVREDDCLSLRTF